MWKAMRMTGSVLAGLGMAVTGASPGLADTVDVAVSPASAGPGTAVTVTAACPTTGGFATSPVLGGGGPVELTGSAGSLEVTGTATVDAGAAPGNYQVDAVCEDDEGSTGDDGSATLTVPGPSPKATPSGTPGHSTTPSPGQHSPKPTVGPATGAGGTQSSGTPWMIGGAVALLAAAGGGVLGWRRLLRSGR